jgi:UDPglucose--hexose-1-phosphate uridylyltransferase
MPEAGSPEIRRDLLTQRWVACAPTRGERPQRTGEDPPADPTEGTPVDGCPFCPGNESMLTSIVLELDGGDGAEASGGRPWRTRVVPNKYPALTPDGDRTAGAPTPAAGLYQACPARGRQEVFVDTPYHREPLYRMPVEQVDAVLHTHLRRYRSLRETEPDLVPFLFHNHGAAAGASLPHPHSQLIATPIAPPAVEQEEGRARRRYDETGRCPYCEMIDREVDDGSRLVDRSERFVAFVPYAAQAPGETWILPRRHEPEVARLNGAGRRALADMLHGVLQALYHRFGAPDFNFFLRSALAYESDAPHLHWSLRLRPRVTVDAGFELGTGMCINPSLPERDAAHLRGEASGDRWDR